MAQILVPLDGSPLAERALALAAMLARANSHQVRLLEAVNLPLGEDMLATVADIEAAAGDYLKAQAEQFERTYGLAASITTKVGPPAPLIVEERSLATCPTSS